MANFLLIIICISAGIILSRLNFLPKDSYKSINAWVLYIALPALFSIGICMHSTGSLAHLSVFEAGMSSHITASLLAGQYNRNPNLCNLMVGSGIIFCFLTSSFWWWLLNLLLPL